MNIGTVLVMSLLYGCIVDVYAASAVRLVSRSAVVGVTELWLSHTVVTDALRRWKWGREYLRLLSSRTVCFPLVGLTLGLCVTTIVVQYGVSLEALSLLVVITAVIVGASVDVELSIYPNALSLSLIAAGLVFAVLEWPVASLSAMLDRLAGGAVAFAVMFGGSEIYYRLRNEHGLGMGDVKICTAVGLFVGWKGFLFFLMTSSFVGTLWGIFLILRGTGSLKTAMPTGGMYAVGLTIVLLFPAAPDRYLGLFKEDGSYQRSPIAAATVSRPIQRMPFGAGVRDAR
jgi:Flp pilus assembly protein protease CpaA